MGGALREVGATTRSSSSFRRQTIAARVVFFFFHGASGCLYPFLGVSLRDKGLEPAQIGLLFASAPLIRSVAAIVWTMAADELSFHRGFLCSAILAGSLLHALFAVLQPDLLYLLPLFCLAEFFVSAVVPLSDSGLLSALEDVDAVSEYGNYRLWGSFSYGIIFSPLTGAVLAVTTGRVHDFGPYAVHVLLCLVACCAATQLSFRPKARAPRGSYDDARSAGARDAHHGKLHDLRRVSEALTRGGVAAHLLLFFLLGGTGGAIDSFLWVDVQSRGGSTLIDGVALAVVAVSEVVVFFFSGRLLRLLGVDGSLALVLGCYVLRLVTYAGLHLEKRERWELLPVQLLNGVTFALFWSTANAYCRSIAPAGLETTMLGIMGAMTNLGSFALTFSGGQVFQRLGAAPLWLMLAALNALCLLVLAATTTQQRRSSMTQEGGDLLREPLLTAPEPDSIQGARAPAPGGPICFDQLSSDEGDEEAAVEVPVVALPKTRRSGGGGVAAV